MTPCGGSVVGTWTVASSCLALSGDMDVVFASLGCMTVPVTGSLHVTGTWIANSNGTYTDNTVTTGMISFPLAPACLSVSSTPVTCTKAASAFSALGWASATCSDASGTCTCTAMANQMGGIGVISPYAMPNGNYTTSGTGLNADSLVDYSSCTSGSMLTLTPKPTILPISGTIVLQKSGTGSGGTTGSGRYDWLGGYDWRRQGRLARQVRLAPQVRQAPQARAGPLARAAGAARAGLVARAVSLAPVAEAARAGPLAPAGRGGTGGTGATGGTTGTAGAGDGSLRYLRSGQQPLRRSAQHGARAPWLVRRRSLQGQTGVRQHDQGHQRREPRRPRRHGHARYVLYGNDVHHHDCCTTSLATATSSRPRRRTAPSAATRA